MVVVVVVVVLLLVRLLLPGAKCGRCFCRRTGKNNFLIGLDWVALVVLPGALSIVAAGSFPAWEKKDLSGFDILVGCGSGGRF